MNYFGRFSSYSWITFICLVVSLIIFLNGFLLTRISIDTKNACETTCSKHDCPIFNTLLSLSNKTNYCQLEAPAKKLIFLIVDGLRFDFLESPFKNQKQPLKHRISIFQELFSRRKDKISIYKFMADPPTTTMQRLKGITTGSLPTFIDISKNFASEEILEDNFIHQLKSKDKGIVFMGDDVWVNFFPQQFKRLYPYPALNVKDLDTVDNGVIKHIFLEMQKDDWDVVIGHFLGVDHCGHTYGRDHPIMSLKLKQMDEVLRRLVKAIDNSPDDILLAVMGDHGMTESGDHGGDSDDEVTSALVLYGNTESLSFSHGNKILEVPQVSLVPTISLLLGLPIPFGNTGSIIPNLSYGKLFSASQISKDIPEIMFRLAAYELNIHQITKYLQTLTQQSSDFPLSELQRQFDRLQTTRTKANHVASTLLSAKSSNETDLHEIDDEYSDFLRSIRSLCVRSWATFNVVAMYIGVACFATATFLFCWDLKISGNTNESRFGTLTAILLHVLLAIAFVFFVTHGTSNDNLTFAVLSLAVIFIVQHSLRNKFLSKIVTALKLNLSSVVTRKSVSILIVVFYNLSSFSNSFVIHEDRISSFSVCSLILTLYLNISVFNPNTFGALSSSKHSPKIKREHVTKLLSNLALVSSGIACVRLGSLFYKCREEQGDSCSPSAFIRPISSFSMDSSHDTFKVVRYFASISSVLIAFLGVKYMLRRLGNLNGFAFTVMLSSYFFVLCPSSLAMSWMIHALPSQVLKRMPNLVEHIIPIFLCSFIILTLLSLWIQPLMIYQYNTTSGELRNFSRTVDPVRQIFHHLKVNWRNHQDQNQDYKVIVYGLSTVYLAGTVTYVMCTVAMAVLLSSDGLAPTYVLAVTSITVVILLESITSTSNFKGYIPFSTILLWFFLCDHFFFATGHQHTFVSIQWNAAFILWKSNNMSNFFAALFTTINTFSNRIIFTSALPLLAIAPPALSVIFPSIFTKHDAKKDDENVGDYALFEKRNDFMSCLKQAFKVWMALHAIKLTFVMCAAAVLSRHLMVWKIFAPRLIFEGASFFVTIPFCLFSYVFAARINYCLEVWIGSLEKEKCK